MASPLLPRLAALAGLALLLALPALTAALDANWVLKLASRMLILGLAATALNLVLGYGGLVSFGHAAFFGLGGYVVAVLFQHQSEGSLFLGLFPGTTDGLLVFPLALLVGGLGALAIGAICLRTSGLYFIMITLAFAQMLHFFFISIRAYGGEDGVSLFGRTTLPFVSLRDSTTFYYVVLCILLAALLFMGRLVRSRFGWALAGVRDNERRMAALGFPVFRIKLAAFVLSGALAGLAGALYANQSGFVSPSLLSWHLSGELLVMVILGGMGTLFGPLAGAVVFLLLEELLRGWTEHWQLFLGPFLVLVVLFARRGLWGWIEGKAR